MESPSSYTLFTDFIEKYRPLEFAGINRQDPYIVQIEEKLGRSNQFFYISNLLKFKVLFVSGGCRHLIGTAPELLDPYTLFERTHPEDQEQYNRAQAKVFKLGHSLFVKKEGIIIVSFRIRVRNSEDNYTDLLLQTYSCYSTLPVQTVYTLTLATKLKANAISKHVRHHYSGTDLAMFRYPDEVLLKAGDIFSVREFEIIKLIASGCGTEQIADKLFLSINTVSTHRRNILSKTNSSSTHELIIELQRTGIL